MSQSVPLYESSFPIRSYETGAGGQLRLDALCSILQEAAGLHAYQLGVAVNQLLESQLTWILARLHVRIRRLPEWQETLVVHTWPAEIDRRYAVRDFRLFINDDQVGEATTAWLMLDVQKKKPVRLPDRVVRMHPDPPVRALQPSFDRLPSIEAGNHRRELHVLYRDLDWNDHANNVAFVAFMLESLGYSFLSRHVATELEVEFRAECLYDDFLLAASQPAGEEDLQWLHRLTRLSDGRELARARSRWRPLQA